jgi:hypothetical protein
VLAIDERSVSFDHGQTFVEVERTREHFERRAVTLGLSDGSNVERVSGIAAGARIKQCDAEPMRRRALPRRVRAFRPRRRRLSRARRILRPSTQKPPNVGLGVGRGRWAAVGRRGRRGQARFRCQRNRPGRSARLTADRRGCVGRALRRGVDLGNPPVFSGEGF